MAARSALVGEVGARIRSLRTARGLTQAQLAAPSYTKAYISMLESGRTRASMKALEHIAGALGVSPSELLGGEVSPDAPQLALLAARRAFVRGDLRSAVAALESLDEGLGADDQALRLRTLAAAYAALGEPKRAFPAVERALRIADTLGDRTERYRLLAVLAAAYARTFAWAEAVTLLRECVDACDAGTVDDPPFQVELLVELGRAHVAQRQPKPALAAFERAIALGEPLAHGHALADAVARMADAQRAGGDLALAGRTLRRSIALHEEVGLIDRLAHSLDGTALLHVELGNRERARDALARGTVLAERTQSEPLLAALQATGAELAAKADPDAAIETAQQALRFARKADAVEAQVRDLVLLGELRMASSPAHARRSFGDARALAEERAPHLLRTVYDRWSRAAELAGDADEALRLARRALETLPG